MPDYVVVFVDQANGNALSAINGPNANKSFTAVDAQDATGQAGVKANRSGKYVAFPVTGLGRAVLFTATGITNGEIAYTAQAAGTGGNSIRVRYVVAGINTTLSVSVSGNDITVNLATNGSGVATSTASQVVTAVNASGPAFALVSAALVPGNSGAGVLAAMGFTSLTVSGYAANIVSVAPGASYTPDTF